MGEHTPTPWEQDGVYIHQSPDPAPTIANCAASPRIQIGQARINAAFIVLACNSHDRLVKALEEIAELPEVRADEASQVARAALASLKEPSQ